MGSLNIRLAYTALQVKDLVKSVKFYTEVLGMTVVTRKSVKQTDGEMCILRSGRNKLELNWYRNAVVRRGNPLDHLAFEIGPFSAFQRFGESLRAEGTRLHEYLETDSWDRFFIKDPDGNWIEIYARKKQLTTSNSRD